MLRIFSVAAVMVCATIAQAGVMSEASLEISNLSAVISGGDVVAGASESGTSFSSVGSDTLGLSFAGTDGMTSAAEGSSSASSASAGDGGSIIAPGGISVTTTASVDIVDPDKFGGQAETTAGVSGSFNFLPGTGTRDLTVSFDGAAARAIAGDGSASSETLFSIFLQRAGSTTNLLGGLEDSAQAALQGSGGGNSVGSFTVTLTGLTADTYTFGVNQRVVVSASAVPEPGTLLAFGTLLIGGVVSRRRRRINA